MTLIMPHAMLVRFSFWWIRADVKRQSKLMLCMLCMLHLASVPWLCVCVCEWAGGSYSVSGPWESLHLGHSMTDVSYIRPPLYCVTVFIQFLSKYFGKAAKRIERLPRIERPLRYSGWSILLALHLEKKTSTMLGNALGAAQGRCNIVFFFFFIHVRSDMLVLSLLLMCLCSLCGKNVLYFPPISCHGRIPLCWLVLLLKVSFEAVVCWYRFDLNSDQVLGHLDHMMREGAAYWLWRKIPPFFNYCYSKCVHSDVFN